MSVMSVLEQQLTDTEKRIGALVRRLEAHGELEESLAQAGNGISQANEEMRQLASSTRAVIESLEGVLAAFREAVEILRRSDPTRTTEAVERVERRLESMEQGITQAIGKAADRTAEAQKKAAESSEERLESVQQGVTQAIGKTTDMIAEAQKKAERQLGEEGRAIRKSIPKTMVYLTFVLVLLLLGLEALHYFPVLQGG